MLAYANLGEYFSPAVPSICGYYLGEAGGRAALSRTEIVVIDMPKPALPFTMLVDIDRTSMRLKYRVVGTGIAKLFGLDFTHHFFDEIVLPGAYRQAAEELYRQVALTGRPAVGQYGYPTYSGKLVLSEFAILRIENDGVVTQCLAVEHLDPRSEAFPSDIISMRPLRANEV